MKVLIITGSSSGIGYSLSKKFSKKYFIVGISKYSEKIRDYNHIDIKIKLNINNHLLLKKKLVQFLNKHKNDIDELNFLFCAGIMGEPKSSLNANITHWKKTLDTNLFSNLLVLNQFKKLISKVNIRVMFFSGGGAAYDYPVFPAYAISKVSTVKLVENLEEDLKNEKKFIIIALSPGSQRTRMQALVRKHGGYIKTKSNLTNLHFFVDVFLKTNRKEISGRLFHVNENINKIKIKNKNSYKLRRVEK